MSGGPAFAVLISGEGSNLQALIDACQRGFIPGHIACVISNRADARGLQRATRAGIAAVSLTAEPTELREQYDQRLQECIDASGAGLVVLAGFMRILSNRFVRHYRGRMLNIHPSLLPLYPGLHTHRRALEAGDTEHGATVHFVTETLDGGPPVLQARVPVAEGDTEGSLSARVQAQEHTLYPLAVRWFQQGRLHHDHDHATLDGKQLPDSGLDLASVPHLEME